MSDNLPTNVQLNANENGSVIFATDVISTIAGLAATEVEGVTSMVGASSNGFSNPFSRKNQNSKALSKGVKVELGADNKVTISLTIIVDYGTPIPEVAGNIQENVKKAIETMSGLTCEAVNVHVQDVSFEMEQRTAAEIEEKQRLMLQQREAGETKAEKPAAESAAQRQAEPEEDEDDFRMDLDDDEDADADEGAEKADEARDEDKQEDGADTDPA